MKFTIAALLATLTTTCFAQNIYIGFPANGTCVSPGSKVVVQVVRPDTLTSSIELGVAIGLFSCAHLETNSVCTSPGQVLGTLLFNGSFNPQFPPPPYESIGPPQQNFTVTIPSTFAHGHAELSVFHTALVGADNEPFAQTVTVVLNVE